jgi:hypothetical protein
VEEDRVMSGRLEEARRFRLHGRTQWDEGNVTDRKNGRGFVW